MDESVGALFLLRFETPVAVSFNFPADKQPKILANCAQTLLREVVLFSQSEILADSNCNFFLMHARSSGGV